MYQVIKKGKKTKIRKPTDKQAKVLINKGYSVIRTQTKNYKNYSKQIKVTLKKRK